jgi:transcriptional regulator with XRE-family HTH domain
MKRTEIGKKIRLARLIKGMTQAELAAKMNVSQGAIGSWEIGYTLPRAGNLVKLSELLEVPVDELIKAG